jgi:hypothetical protein
MALIKYGPTIASASGSVGGLTYARNRAGAYMRQRSKPVVPVSARREAINAILSDLITEWQTGLSTTQRNAWNAVGSNTSLPNKLGDGYTPTGLNLWIRSNSLLELSVQSQITVPPTQPTAPQFAPTLVHTPATGIVLTDVGLFDSALLGKILFFKSAALRQSINYHKGPWASYSYQTIAIMANPPVTLMASAALQINSRYFIKFQTILESGAVSAPSIMSCDVGGVV